MVHSSAPFSGQSGYLAPTARALVLALLFGPLLGPAAAWADARRYDGRVIAEVEYRGLETLTAETMDYYLFGGATAKGQRLDLDQLNDRVKRLWDRELVDDVRVEAEPAGADAKLIVTVKERPILVSIDYKGLKRLARKDITDRIDRERIGVYEGQPLKLGEMRRLQDAIEELYREKGYRFAEVETTLEDMGKGQKRAILSIDEGDKVRIGDIDFDGNTVYSDLRLRLSMKKTKEAGIISRLTKKDIYNPANIDEDLDKVRDLYRKAGYKDVIVGRPELAVTAKRPAAATIRDQKRRLAITVPIEEGERWRLGEITIEGNEVFSDELLLRQFERPRGGWLRSKAIDDGLENVRKLYSSVGYIFSNVSTELKERDENVADVVVKVEERDQYKIGRLEFRGNTKTQDKVLRREMLIHEGMVMSMTGLQNSLLKIKQLNYFKLDEEEPVDFDFDAERKEVDLTLKGEEAERTELQFGGGWSELDGFFGQFAMRTSNFLGRGEALGVSVQTGRRRSLYDLSYQVPWFLDRPQTIGIRAFKQDFESPILTGVDFEQKYKGLSLTYGRSFYGFQSFNVVYSFADVLDTRIFDPGDGTDRLVSEVSFKSSSVRPIWSRNTLDSRFEPTRGLDLLGSVEYAGSFLGGDTSFVRPQLTMSWFKPVSRQPFKSSFGVNVELGYIASLDKQPFPTGDSRNDQLVDGLFPQQRFFLGGETSVRGFGRRSIVVREENGAIRRDPSGFPLGGIAMLQANAEYHIIPGGPFRFVLFADAGAVFDDDQLVDLGLLRYSAGVELRITVPLFPAPLRFIYATNLDPFENLSAADRERFQSFDFSIGTTF